MGKSRIAAIGTIGALGAVTVAVALSAHAGADEAATERRAEATLVDATGTVVGSARFVEDGIGRVHVVVRVRGLAPGLHGIHVHGAGACTPTFDAAGSHHNPLNRLHGEHAGDLPNLDVNRSGLGRLQATTESFTLSTGPTGAFDANGSALVVHALPDDFVTQPTGGSGARVACGVITRE
jgi:Cu-Zn family superoxide dismutase